MGLWGRVQGLRVPALIGFECKVQAFTVLRAFGLMQGEGLRGLRGHSSGSLNPTKNIATPSST